MNKEQLAELRMVKTVPDIVSIQHLRNKTPRTLLYGYNSDRSTVHVYICPQWGEIVTAVYGGYDDTPMHRRVIFTNDDYVPSKRLYPSRCDYEFCRLLTQRGVYMTFTTWEDHEEETFYGRRFHVHR